MTPTEEDLAHDLAADLRGLEASGWLAHPEPWVRYSRSWACALRRAIHAEAQLLLAEAEIARLRGIVEGLAARVAGQSELLGRRAEGGAS